MPSPQLCRTWFRAYLAAPNLTAAAGADNRREKPQEGGPKCPAKYRASTWHCGACPNGLVYGPGSSCPRARKTTKGAPDPQARIRAWSRAYDRWRHNEAALCACDVIFWPRDILKSRESLLWWECMLGLAPLWSWALLFMKGKITNKMDELPTLGWKCLKWIKICRIHPCVILSLWWL
jgi:hypothetical protein